MAEVPCHRPVSVCLHRAASALLGVGAPPPGQTPAPVPANAACGPFPAPGAAAGVLLTPARAPRPRSFPFLSSPLLAPAGPQWTWCPTRLLRTLRPTRAVAGPRGTENVPSPGVSGPSHSSVDNRCRPSGPGRPRAVLASGRPRPLSKSARFLRENTPMRLCCIHSRPWEMSGKGLCPPAR